MDRQNESKKRYFAWTGPVAKPVIFYTRSKREALSWKQKGLNVYEGVRL